MSCVAEARQKAPIARASASCVCAARPGTARQASAITRSELAIQRRHSPKRSSSGAQSAFTDHAKPITETKPIALRESPLSRRKTGQTSA